MKRIYTKKGEEILVSDEDFDYLNQFSWSLTEGYVRRSKWVNGKPTSVYMGRDLLNPSSDEIVSYQDGNRLNNTRENLLITPKYMPYRKPNPTGFRGVRQQKGYLRWISEISVKGKNIYLGCFDSPEEAHEAYLEAQSLYRS